MGVPPLNKKAVFLDRDGVINRALVIDNLPYPPNSIKDLEILPEVPKSLRLLEDKGYLLLVVTNQPDVGRGIQKRETVEEIHSFLLEELPLDEIYVCWHGQDGDCDCRKPLPGMLSQAAEKYGINLKESFLIGDRWKDINAGMSAGCQTVFLDHGYKETLRQTPTYQTNSILTATTWILNRQLLSV